MAEDWLADVRKYVPGADENVVGAIVKHLGIALRNRDSSLVSFSDPIEVERVRESYLRKKLALTEPDSLLDEGLDWVKKLMAGDRTKNRVTVYYLLAHFFGKLDLFGGATGTSSASLGDGASLSTAKPTPEPIVAMPSSDRAQSTPPRSVGQPSYAAALEDEPEKSRGWPGWLTWLLLALAVLALIFLFKSCSAERPVGADDVAAVAEAVPSGSEINSGAQVAEDSAAAAIPAGAGVVSTVKDNKPQLNVYFASGQSAVTNDLAGATETLKSYLDAHTGAKLAVSGYNDPSGNAALNAALSKKRAQGVAAALVAAGIPEGSIELVKPANATSTSVTPEQARRVEVTIE